MLNLINDNIIMICYFLNPNELINFLLTNKIIFNIINKKINYISKYILLNCYKYKLIIYNDSFNLYKDNKTLSFPKNSNVNFLNWKLIFIKILKLKI